LESAGAAFQQFREARQDYVIEAERQLTYEGGATKFIGVTITVRNRAGRDFVVSGREAQAGETRELVARIYEDVAAVLQIAEVRQRLIDIGGNPGGEPPEQFAARVRTDIDKWKNVARLAGVKPQ
jgi:tripartite-type tricarboxylate transporter receptor subunit TctC